MDERMRWMMACRNKDAEILELEAKLQKCKRALLQIHKMAITDRAALKWQQVEAVVDQVIDEVEE